MKSNGENSVTWLMLIVLLLLLGNGFHLPIIGGSAPFPADHLMMLVVEETELEQNLTPGQRNAFHSTKDGSVLSQLGPGNWRIIDKDSNTEREAEPWKTAFKAAKTEKLPSLVISNGRSGYVGPSPETEDQIKALIGKYKR